MTEQAKKEDPEVTEMTSIKVKRQCGVKSAATGYPILMIKSTATETPQPQTGLSGAEHAQALAAIKAVGANGEIDETADIGTAEQILVLLSKLIASEASEMATGQWDESCDISLLSDAVRCMRWFLQSEQMEKELAAFEVVMKAEEDAIEEAGGVVKRKFSADRRRQLASEGNALEDGSYPIENEEDLHNAAVLARSGHGNVAAARRLIARRAKELGVANPLTDHDNSKASGPEPVPDKKEEDGALLKRIEEAEAEATRSRERVEALEEKLAKVLDTPIPGAPVVTVPHAIRKERDEEERQLQAARYRRLAQETTDPDMRDFYKQRARALSGKEE